MATRSIAPPGPPNPPEDARHSPPRQPRANATGGAPADRGARAPRKRRLSARAHAWLGLAAPLALGALILALWQLITAGGVVNTFLLPEPGTVLHAFWFSLTDGCAREGVACAGGPGAAWTAISHSLLATYSAVTVVESLAGCALGALVALPLGYAVARWRLVAATTQPYLAASQALPAVAVAPLLALWLGYNLSPVIALCALIVFFPLAITTTLGVRLLDRDVLDAARVDGAGFWSLLWHIELPLALPSILAGLRASLTLSVTGAVVGEWASGSNGLGQLLLIDRNYADPAGEFATLLMLGLLAAALYGAVRIGERRLSFMEAS